MSQPLDESYFVWLYSEIGSVELTDPTRTYWDLARILYKKEFAWTVPNDDNRAVDGQLLREEFLNQHGVPLDQADKLWMRMACSMLEMLVGLSRRLAFEGEGRPSAWFWEMMLNIHLHRYNDASRIPKRIVDGRLDTVIWRTYEDTGQGGLFPLRRPQKDQRKVELWYQMSAYLLERDG